MNDKTPMQTSEWAAQERGMRAALGRDAGALDKVAASYRVVTESLMSGPRSEPPDDFASDVVKRVARHEAGIERLLSRLLLVVFVLASSIVVALYGEQWWQALQQTVLDGALGWVLTGMACVAASWVFSRGLELASLAREPGRAA